MDTVAAKDKRAGIRIPLLSEIVTYFHNGVEKRSDISDITNEGLFIKTNEILRPHTELLLQIHLPGDLGTVQVKASVTRVNWAVNKKKSRENLGMGVRFEEVPANIKKIIDAYVVYLRNKQIITVSKRIIEEFFGSEGPKKVF